jgi:hypothetical protein
MLACQENENIKSDFTGNETTYALASGSQYNIEGTVTFKEKRDGSTLISLDLDGTAGNIQHPVHLHLGKISVVGADIAALLTPVQGTTGESEMVLTRLADESSISYSQLIGLDACIKVHLAASGPDKDIILAGGNIGKAASDDAGRAGFGVCQSE